MGSYLFADLYVNYVRVDLVNFVKEAWTAFVKDAGAAFSTPAV